MNMSVLKAVVFDLDDTLYPERDYVFSGFRAVAAWAEAHLGIPADGGFEELKSLFTDGVRGNTFDQWLGAHGFQPESYAQQLVRIYRDHDPVLKLFPEVFKVLVCLQKHYRLGIVSDGYYEVQRRKFLALGINDLFQAVVFSDEFGRNAWKPSVIPFEVVLRKLGVEPVTAVYVADNPLKDFFGARKIGMSTVQVRRQKGEYFNRQPQSQEYAPHHIVSSLAELERLFE